MNMKGAGVGFGVYPPTIDTTGKYIEYIGTSAASTVTSWTCHRTERLGFEIVSQQSYCYNIFVL